MEYFNHEHFNKALRASIDDIILKVESMEMCDDAGWSAA